MGIRYIILKISYRIHTYFAKTKTMSIVNGIVVTNQCNCVTLN